MIKNSAYEFPNSFYDFALMPKFQDCIEELRNLAEPEDWGYKNTTDTFKFPILKNYLLYTYQRIAEWMLRRHYWSTCSTGRTFGNHEKQSARSDYHWLDSQFL